MAGSAAREDAMDVAACPHCQGTTWRHVKDAAGVTRVERCACWQAARKVFAEGVPLEFQGATVANYRELAGNRSAIDLAKTFHAGTRDLYLCGGVGSGKSRLACSLLNDAYQAGTPGLFARVPMLLLQLQPRRDEEAADQARTLFDRLCVAPLIVLDDIGAERESATDYTKRTLLTLYEARGDAGVRTIWTSNLRLAPKPGPSVARPVTLADFMADDRLPSRIAGRADVVWLDTTDQRLARRVREDR